MIIGAKKTFKFFFQKRKAKGTACFLGGILLVLYGWAMIGALGIAPPARPRTGEFASVRAAT